MTDMKAVYVSYCYWNNCIFTVAGSEAVIVFEALLEFFMHRHPTMSS